MCCRRWDRGVGWCVRRLEPGRTWALASFEHLAVWTYLHLYLLHPSYPNALPLIETCISSRLAAIGMATWHVCSTFHIRALMSDRPWECPALQPRSLHPSYPNDLALIETCVSSTLAAIVMVTFSTFHVLALTSDRPSERPAQPPHSLHLRCHRHDS